MNWLYARAKGGKFIVRIGDMDLVRGRTETVHRILDDVRWLEVDWDEGPDIGGTSSPYLQSGRKDRYVKVLDKLRSSPRVYAPSDVEEPDVAGDDDSDATPAKGRAHAKGGAHLEADEDTLARWIAEGRPYVLRFRLERSSPTDFKDLVTGVRSIDFSDVEDPIVQRADGSPSPFLAAVVDDADMKITHAFRPDSECVRSAMEASLADALGMRTPKVGHFPRLTGADGKPYSRRHGAFTVDSFKKLGYLPRTLSNYLTHLAWSRRGIGDKFDVRDLEEKFHVAGMRKDTLPFVFTELNSLSTAYIVEEDLEHLVDRVLPYLIEGRFLEDEYDREKLKRILDTIRPSLKCLSEIVKYVDIFFGDTVIEPRGKEVLKDESAARVLRLFREHLSATPELDETKFDSVLEQMLAETGFDADRLMLPIRAALTGVTQGDDLDKIASILGSRVCIGKVDRVLADERSR